MIFSPEIASSLEVAVTATHAEFAATMTTGEYWLFVSNTNCWIKQGSPTATITCVAKASMADTDFITINDGINSSSIYEFDTVGDGVTGGRVQVNISGATTAAQVAAILKTAINLTQTYITVTDAGLGVLTLASTSRNITVTETVANGGFTVAYTPQATAAALSMYVPANYPVILRGSQGSNLSVLRDTADGKASLTKHFVF